MTVQGREVVDDLKLTAFPKYKPPARERAKYPIPGSKNWLWNRLHPQNGETSAALPPVVPDSAGRLAVEPGESPQTEPSNDAEQMMEVDSQGESRPAEAGKDEKVKTTKQSAAAKDLKQVAQEVWKKYGEAGTQITADGWKLPPMEILDNAPEVEFSQADNLKKAKLIEDALASYGVEGKVVQINVGPTVTQFGIEPGWDRKLKEIKEKDKNGDVQVKDRRGRQDPGQGGPDYLPLQRSVAGSGGAQHPYRSPGAG